MKKRIFSIISILIFCLVVLLVPLYILQRTIDSDKYKVSSIDRKASKDKIALALGKENRYTKLLLLSGKLKANKKVIREKQLSQIKKNQVITAAKLEIGELTKQGYYGLAIKEKKDDSYKISVEEYRYTEQIFGKYTCDVVKIIFENKAAKEIIVLDAKDYTIYSLTMELKRGMKAGQSYLNSMDKVSKNEVDAYLKPFSNMITGNKDLNIATNDAKHTVSIRIVKRSDVKIKEKVKENEYHIAEKDGPSYYARLEKKPKSLKYQLLSAK